MQNTYNSIEYNPDDPHWYLMVNWNPFVSEVFDSRSNLSVRPTEVQCFRNMQNECRRFEWKNHPNNPANKSYDEDV